MKTGPDSRFVATTNAIVGRFRCAYFELSLSGCIKGSHGYLSKVKEAAELTCPSLVTLSDHHMPPRKANNFKVSGSSVMFDEHTFVGVRLDSDGTRAAIRKVPLNISVGAKARRSVKRVTEKKVLHDRDRTLGGSSLFSVQLTRYLSSCNHLL
jgi:hypothetical protein